MLPERRRGWWPVPSLRLQLVLIPAAILLLALATAIGATLIRAQGRIEDEVRSSMELGQHLVAALVDRAGSRQELDASRDMLEEQLGHIRHVRILVRSVAELIAPSVRVVTDAAEEEGGNDHKQVPQHDNPPQWSRHSRAGGLPKRQCCACIAPADL